MSETEQFLEAVESIDDEKTKNIIMSYTTNQIKYYKKKVKYVLDKQRVKEAIFRAYQMQYLNNDDRHNKIMSDYMRQLEEELGLEQKQEVER